GLRCINDTQLSDLNLVDADGLRIIDSLRFFINGEPQLVYPLYEMIFNNASRVEIRPVNGKRKSPTRTRDPLPVYLPATSLKPVGFEPDQGMLSYSARSFSGYRLLTEYFAFPDKFLFFEVRGLDVAARSGAFDEFEIWVSLRNISPPLSSIDQNTFQLGCTPIVNLFTKVAEPIALTGQQNEYQVVPDVHRQMATEVYSIDAVTSADPYLQESRDFQPFYSYKQINQDEDGRAFWYATRRPSARKDDPGTEVFVS